MKKLKTDELGRPSVEEFKNQQKHPVVLVLDNIRSMHNVGSAFRTSDAFAIEEVLLCGITATPPHREIHKTALGAQDSVNWRAFDSTLEAIRSLKKEGYVIIALEHTDKSVFIQEYDFPASKIAFVFGNEAFGVEEEVLDQSDVVLEIPQYGTKHSLNVSVSIGVTLWHYLSVTKHNEHS
jgi:tRNA G18 (ribose-2'-O)-methylase SpoU